MHACRLWSVGFVKKVSLESDESERGIVKQSCKHKYNIYLEFLRDIHE